MKNKLIFSMIPIYVIVIGILITVTIFGSDAISVYSQNIMLNNRTCIVIDAGHGGEDGGAVSVTGMPESQINLEIALKTNDLLNLLGITTKMIRSDDRSIYTRGNTLAQKKISDLKERVRIVNEADNHILLSIHQNYFSDEKYAGFQTFYPKTKGSIDLAKEIQDNSTILDPNNKRKIKPINGVYVMEHVNCTAVLVECGFLSNYKEESLLRDEIYQQKIAAVLATTTSNYLDRIYDY